MTSPTERSEAKKILDLILLNPFHYIAGIKALILGVIILLLTGYLGFLSGCRFEGLTSIHFIGLQQSVLLNNLLDGMISLLIISILLLIAGKIISKSRFRIVDVIGTQALARFPYLIFALIALIPGITISSVRYQRRLSSLENLTDFISVDLIPFIIIFGAIILLSVWMITLMYNAFSVSCNVSGKKAFFGFGICFLIGAIFSPVIINHITIKSENQAQVTVQKVDVESKLDKAISLVAENKFNEALTIADDDFKSLYSVEEMKAGWISIISRYGSYKNHGQILITQKGNYSVCDVICYFEKGWVHYRYEFNEKGKVSSLVIP
jgi:hypothetical protein